MPIVKKDRFFGEGVSTYGEANAISALEQHRRHVRIMRLNDLLGRDSKLDNGELERKFYQIKAAIEAADAQVVQDNKDFMDEHRVTL